MIKLNFPLKCIIIFLAVCLLASLISPFLDSPNTNITVNPYSIKLGENSYGTVTKLGPYGNASSPVTVAYLVGVHPWEQYSHDAAVKAVQTKSKNLKYCYYIYKIEVVGGIDSDYESGRTGGQLLAKDFVLPDMEKNNYQLVMDIHSNKGEEDYYSVNWFINVPYNDERTNKIAQELLTKVPELVTYEPPVSSSPYYVTIPIIKAGTPAIIYEAYAYDSPEERYNHAVRVLLAVDNLQTLEPNFKQLA